MPETAPSTTTGNPFNLVAYLLFHVRHALEDRDDPRDPRWVRIARARHAHDNSDKIADIVRQAIDAVADGLSNLVELTLDIREVLVQADAAVALAEVTARFIREASSDTFWNGLTTLVGAGAGHTSPLAPIGSVVGQLEQYLGYIPEPDDLLSLEGELYRLLCIEQLRLPVTDDDKAAARSAPLGFNVRRSGKVRLLQWAFAQGITSYGLGAGESNEQKLYRLGSRPLWNTSNDKLPPRVAIAWPGDQDPILELKYDEREDVAHRTLDLQELHEVLEKHGYTTPAIADKTRFSNDLIKRLTRFQMMNGLVVTSKLDNTTLNLLMNLDFTTKRLRRAKPFDAAQAPAPAEEQHYDPIVVPQPLADVFRLVNPDADSPGDESIIEERKPNANTRYRYRYYVAGHHTLGGAPAPVPPGGGWITHEGDHFIQGFVAMESRQVVAGTGGSTDGRLEGGALSEGEASSGTYFFAARFTQPWIPGRDNPPIDAVYPNAAALPAADSLSSMYQWVPLTGIARPAGWKLCVNARVLQRSLFENRRARNGLSDQGRLGIEFYGGDVFATTDPERLGRPRPDPDANPDTPALQPESTNRKLTITPATRTIDLKRYFTGWFPPDRQTVDHELSLGQIANKRHWTAASIDRVEVPANATAMLVILEGRMQAGWDIDAYFDDVEVSWHLEPVTTP
jgi:hypothetical protein